MMNLAAYLRGVDRLENEAEIQAGPQPSKGRAPRQVTSVRQTPACGCIVFPLRRSWTLGYSVLSLARKCRSAGSGAPTFTDILHLACSMDRCVCSLSQRTLLGAANRSSEPRSEIPVVADSGRRSTRPSIQSSISSSSQPTARAPSDTWCGNSLFAILL